ncbi:cell division protein FtsA [Sphingomonas nostoxanthinifaciens]|uniref:cell division protein FtsA n=1 Tax=Sphingomonas nostoxanthinifaciens TaxID=2872652 RepID=UPI001CC1F0A4|nr:cell division protein FtsA [Sphingomonas nostoxanthinifaciens]UAK24945.1 cell division protein FtsA [Sphingomonas nostoxanthinifaciens]
MAQARNEGLITAVDIGSSKVAALIAQPTEGGLQVLGTGQRESRGVKHGLVADMERTEHAVREAVEQAERIARTNIEEVWVSFSAGGLYSDVASVEVALEGQRIGQPDVDDLLEAGRRSIDPEGRMVLHAQPTLYTLDGLKGVRNPIGLHAEKLGVDIHVVSADPAPVRNLDFAVRSAHLAVKSIVASPIATAMACLTEEERELGVALVELGAGVTNVSLFAGGLLVGLASLPIGAGEITDDIASAFGTRRAQAERLKCFHGSAQTSPRDNHEMIEVSGEADGAEPLRVSRAQLIGVIRTRLEHWFAEIEKALKALGFTGPIARRLVLTGGGAELKGIADYAQSVLGRAVRVGRPKGLIGVPEAHSGMGFATLAGLVLFAASDPIDLRQTITPQLVTKLTPQGLVQRLLSAVKTSY